MTLSSNRLVILFCGVGHFYFHVLVALFLTVSLVLEELWAVPYDELIRLWTFGALLLGLGAPLAGWCSDRWGETSVMIAFFLGSGLGSLLCGFAEGPIALALSLGVLGTFGAIYHPVGTAWVVKNSAARGKTIAGVGICGSLGLAAASLVAGTLTDRIDWRAAFAIPGAVTIATGLLLVWLFRRGAIVDRTHDLMASADPSPAEARRALAVLLVTLSLTTVAYHAFTTALPKWLSAGLTAGLGGSLSELGGLIGGIYLFGAFAQLIGGHFADRGAAKLVYVASYALKLGALLLAVGLSGWPLLVVAVAIVVVFDIAAPVENVLIARFASSRRRGLAYGVRNGIAMIAAPLGVQMVGWLYDADGGFDGLFLALAVLVAVILGAALLLPSDRPAGVAA